MDGSEKIKNIAFLLFVFIFFQACSTPKKASLHLYENDDENIDISKIIRDIDTDLVYESIDTNRFEVIERQHDIKSNYQIDSIELFQSILEKKYADSLLYQFDIEMISAKSLDLDSNFTSQDIIKPVRDTIFIEKEIITEKTDTIFVEKEVLVERVDTVLAKTSTVAPQTSKSALIIPPIPTDEKIDSTAIEKSTFIHSEDSENDEIFLPSENLYIPVILPIKKDSTTENLSEKIEFIDTKDSSSLFQIYAQYGVYLNKLLKDEAIYTDEEKAIIQNLKEQVTIYDDKDSTVNLTFNFITFQSSNYLKIDSLNAIKNAFISETDTLKSDTLAFERNELLEKTPKKKVEDIINEKVSKRESQEKQLQGKWTEIFPQIKTTKDSTLIVVNYSPNKTLPDSFDELAAAIEEMLAYYNSKNATVLLSSHTDSQGSADYNLQLSETRAKNLKAALIKKGISEHQIFYQYFGSKYATSPPNPTERRVEVLILR